MSNEREKYILALANLVNGSLLGYEDRSRVPEYEKTVDDYVDNLEQENQELKEDILFCLKSIKQEMEMSTDSRTRGEMKSCYEILKRWNNE